MSDREGAHQIFHMRSCASQTPLQLGWKHVMGSGQWTVDRVGRCLSQAEVVESDCAYSLPLCPATGRPWVPGGIASRRDKLYKAFTRLYTREK